MRDVIRYRIFVTDIADFPAVGAELGRVFGEIRPAGTLVGISDPGQPGRCSVEIEVDAIVGSGGGGSVEDEAVSVDQTSS